MNEQRRIRLRLYSRRRRGLIRGRCFMLQARALAGFHSVLDEIVISSFDEAEA
jgi:hypothetical protein